MEFDLLHEDTDCNCTDGATQDFQNLYARKINKPDISEKDLKTHWERGKRPDSLSCVCVCGYKGVSVDSWNESSEDVVIGKFLTTFRITPRHKDSIYIFRLKQDAGLLKHTPTKDDPFHYDFYKSDEFKQQMLEEVEIISLSGLLTKSTNE
jgi:hypothetical protein